MRLNVWQRHEEDIARRQAGATESRVVDTVRHEVTGIAARCRRIEQW